MSRGGRAASRWVALDQIKYWEDNPNEGDIGAIIESIRRFGYNDVVHLWQHRELRGGNHRIKSLRILLESEWGPFGDCIRDNGGGVEVRYTDISHMSKSEADAFGIALNRLTRRGADDPLRLASLLIELEPLGLLGVTGYDGDDLDDLRKMASLELPVLEPLDQDDIETQPHEGDPMPFLAIPFESDNDYGIPLLPLEAQAVEIIQPVTKWGVMGRTDRMEGTYHFYTHDYKFSGLVNTPDKLLESGCQVVCEVNGSTYEGMPLAVFLAEVYIKRWLACYWASRGVKILVDLNVEPEFDDWNLLGVPDDWKAYSTRFIGGDFDHLQRCFEIGCGIAGTDDILFVVFGGTDQVRQMCQEKGWTHVPEDSELVRGYV